MRQISTSTSLQLLSAHKLLLLQLIFLLLLVAFPKIHPTTLLFVHSLSTSSLPSNSQNKNNINANNTPSSSTSPTIHTLLLCRHGDSIWNGGSPGSQETFTGWTDVPLSSKGVTEAKNTARELASSYSHGIDACFTSILVRARETAHYCCWAFAEKSYWMEPQKYVSDYRLNERHYGALQGYVKEEVERGVYGHDGRLVQAWRRSWYAVPPLLEEEDPRRLEELQKYRHSCGGRHENVPRGESLEMVARDRIRPFLDSVLHPVLTEAAQAKREQVVARRRKEDGDSDVEMWTNEEQVSSTLGGCGLVVAHANSLRALIGVLCQVEKDEVALKQLEGMKIQTGVPLIMRYRQLPDGTYEACPLPEMNQEETFGMGGMGIGGGGGASLPVWPLSVLPKRNLNGLTSPLYDDDDLTSGSKKRRAREIRIDVI
jgi:2,3-bisphosphoglycerate-dependent phosphoglycerate mutase